MMLNGVNTLRKYMLEENTFVKYTFEKYIFKKYAFEKYSLRNILLMRSLAKIVVVWAEKRNVAKWGQLPNLEQTCHASKTIHGRFED